MTQDAQFANASETGEIPSFNGSEKAKATDFANYFCSYAQLYHQKQMLADHNRMAAYHSAIMGNASVFKDKVVMDVGTGSGILAVWAAQAGARRVFAIEYTDMAKHAQSVMEANGVADIVTVIQGAVEEIVLPPVGGGMDTSGDGNNSTQVVDIIISEWMGYFLLRESMLDSIVRARDKFLKPSTGLMFPSHVTMFFAPVRDEEERQQSLREYNNAMGDWSEFAETTRTTYGVDMDVLSKNYDKEQKEYYLLSSRWAELRPEALLVQNPAPVKYMDMITCTIADSRGIEAGAAESEFDFDVVAGKNSNSISPNGGINNEGTRSSTSISGFAGWFTADFKSRTDDVGKDTAPKLQHPAFLSTGPEAGYTHWGQQVFHLMSSIPLIHGETTRLKGSIEMMRTKDNARLYNSRIRYEVSRRKSPVPKDGPLLMKGKVTENIYQIP